MKAKANQYTHSKDINKDIKELLSKKLLSEVKDIDTLLGKLEPKERADLITKLIPYVLCKSKEQLQLKDLTNTETDLQFTDYWEKS